MSKVTYTDDGMNFDGDLDFDFDTKPKKMADMSRREIVKEAASGFYEGAKGELASVQKWRRSLEKSLPKGFSQSWDAYDETAQSVSDLYNHAEKEIKPLLGQLAFKIDSFVPENLESIKKFTTSLKDSLYDAPRFNGKESLESTMQAGVAKVLGETFQAERELQQEQEKVKQKRQVAEDAVRESIDNRRHASEIKLFSNISNNVSRLTTYQMNTGIAVQKKSLEISMRQYMLLGQMHQHQLTQGNIFQEQLKAIIKHTSLPDEAKVTMSDRFKDTMKSRAIGGLHDQMFPNGSILTQGLNKLKRDAKNSISDFASQMEMLLSLGDAADMIFGEDAFESTPKTIGNLAGGAVSGWARNKLANPLGKKLSKIPGFEEGLAHIRRYAVNPNYGLEDLKKSEFWKKIQGSKLEGPLEAVFDTLKSAFKPGGYNTKLSSGLGIGQSLAPGSFTKRLEIVQTQVVPGYLARILQAVSSLKTKSKVPLLHFDPITGSFKNESALQKSTEAIIEREAQRANIGYQTKYIANEIGQKVGVAENDTMIIGRLMLELTKSSKPITPETITGSSIYKKATSIEKKALDAVAFQISKPGAEGKNFVGDLEDNLASMRKSMPTHSAIMQQLVDAGLMEQLVKAKYASVDENGGLSLRPEAVDDLLEKSLGYNYKSDDEVDEYSRIKRQKVREAYEAQKNPGSAVDELKAALKIKKKPKNIDAEIEKAVEEALKKKQNDSMNVTPGSGQDDPKIGNSDKEMKSKFAAFDSKFALEGIKKTPVTSWNYKTDPSTDAKKVGPMSQDLHKNFGNFVAPDGKKINLISMNGINMAAIQGLAKRQDDMESRFKSEHGLDPNKKKQEFLLFAINENIIRLDKTLKDKTFGFSLEGIDAESLKKLGLDVLGSAKDKSKETLDKAKVKASAIIKTGNYYIDTIQEIAVSGLNDLYGKGKQGKDFAVDKSKEFWANNKAAIKQKKDLFIEKSFEFYGKTLDFGRDMLFNQIPEKAKEAWEYLKEGKEKLKAIVSGPKDVYIKGSLSPVLRAERMRAGFYVDAETGMVIRSIDALLKIKGDVYDSGKKEVVLTRSDLADGVYDEKGTKLLTLKDTAMGLVIAGGQYLYDKASKGFNFLKKEGTSLAGKALEWWKDPSSFKEILKSTFTSVKDKIGGFKGVAFYDKRQITVLAQIRDLLAIGKKKKLVEHVYHRNLEDQSYLKGDGFLGMLGLKAKSEESQGNPGTDVPAGTPVSPEAADQPQGNSSVSSDKMAETFSKENIEKAVEKSKELKDKVLNSPLGQKAKNTWLNSYLGKKITAAKNKLQKTGEQIANSKLVQTTKNKTKQGLTNADEFVKESGQQAVNLVSQLSKNPAFQTLMKGLVGFKEAYTGEVQIGKNVPKESFSEGLLNKLKLQNMTTQGQKSLDDKANSKWGRFKSDMAERAEAVTGPIADRWGRIKGRMGGKVGKAWELAKSAGSMIGSGISAAGGFLKNMIGETVNERSNNDFGTALGNVSGPTGTIRGTGDGVKGKNDSDGDGERDGGSTEMLRSNREKETLRRQEESQKAQDAAKRAADSSLKYRSSENAIDRMMKGASGLIDYLKENAGAMFSTALNALQMIPGMGKLLKLGGGAMKTLGKGVMAAGRWGLGKLGVVANGARAAFAAGGIRGLATAALSKTGAALNVARTVAIASGGVSGSVVGLGLTAAKSVLAVLASPLVIKGALIAGAAYGIYKTYKYFTRNNADAFQKLRLVQYGFKEDHSQQHRIMALEDYFLDGRYTPHFGGSFIQQKLKEEEILEIMDIDPKDEKRKQSFYLWLNGRFKPFFLTHVTAMYAADPKLKLQDASKLEFEALGKYLDKAQYLDGPYNVEESPFSVDEKVVNTSQDIPEMVEKLRHSKKKGKETGKSNVKAVSEDAKLTSNLNASKAEQAEEAKRQAVLAAQGLTEKKKETSNVLANTQANSSKGLTAPLTAAQVGEDANAPTSPTGKPSQADGVKSVSIGTLPEAQGPLALDQDGTRFLNVKQGVNINNLHPNIRRYLSAMAAEYGKITGNMIPITDGFRSYAEQAALYQRMPNKAAKPGFSMHEHGLAFDMDSKVANELDKLGLLRKYGFTRPVGGEPWHIEPAGVQLDVNRAKSDPGWATSQIEASPGRGGGGYGSQSGSTMKRRNPAYAVELWNASSTSKLALAEKSKSDTGTAAVASGGANKGTTAPGQGSSEGTIKGMTTPGQGSSELLAKNGATVGQVNQTLNAATSNQQSEGETPPSANSSSDSPFKPKGTGVVEQTKEAAAAAAKKAGLDPSTLQLFAAVESSMGQKTNSGKSSAQGPFQFIPSTWKEVVKNHGQKYGVTPEDSPSDPYKSGLMTAAYMKENEPKIKKHKSTADIRDFYMAHMLGGSGVQTFLKMRPEDIPATMMPGAARNNSSVFYKDYKNLKEPYTKAQVDEHLSQKFTKLGQAFGVPVNFGTSTTPANDSKQEPVTAPMPTMPKQNGMMTASYQPASDEPSSTPERSETSMFTNNQVEKRKPVETMRGDAGQASGVFSAIERSATASEQLLQSVQNDVVPVLRGMHETLLNMYKGKSDTLSKADETTKAPTPPQGTTSAVSSSSLDRARKYGT